MSNKRKSRPANQRPAGAPSKPKASPAPSGPTPKPGPAEAARPARSYGLWIALGAAVVVGVVIIGGVFLLTRPAPGSADNPAAKNPAYQIGGVSYCKKQPRFVQDLHLGTNYAAAFSTSERGIKGLALLIQPTNQSGETRTYQNPSWTMAGSLAPIQYGKDGNLFVAPAPSINVLDNQPDQQNQIYRVDSATGVMARFMDLPRAGPSTPENPFGVLGLGYDCDTDKLYVTSVAGSSRDQEIGRIYQIDPAKGIVESQLDKIDALGMTIFNGAKGKRLYYGLARWPEIWSVALDDKGHFQGQPRFEFSLANLGPRGSDKARSIEFVRDTQMVVHGIEFSFNLIAPTEKQETIYNFKYDQTADKWTLIPGPNT
jgi:hypothetical protein